MCKVKILNSSKWISNHRSWKIVIVECKYINKVLKYYKGGKYLHCQQLLVTRTRGRWYKLTAEISRVTLFEWHYGRFWNTEQYRGHSNHESNVTSSIALDKLWNSYESVFSPLKLEKVKPLHSHQVRKIGSHPVPFMLDLRPYLLLNVFPRKADRKLKIPASQDFFPLASLQFFLGIKKMYQPQI